MSNWEFETIVKEKTPMTKEEVENYILLKGQNGERWFTLRFVDEEMKAHLDMANFGIESAGHLGQHFFE